MSSNEKHVTNSGFVSLPVFCLFIFVLLLDPNTSGVCSMYSAATKRQVALILCFIFQRFSRLQVTRYNWCKIKNNTCNTCNSSVAILAKDVKKELLKEMCKGSLFILILAPKLHVSSNLYQLRILDIYETKTAKFCYFWTLWSVIQLINHLFKTQQKAFLPNFSTIWYRSISLITNQNVRKCQILAIYAS